MAFPFLNMLSFWVTFVGLAVLVLGRTRFGRGLQAIAADVEGAQFVGPPRRLCGR